MNSETIAIWVLVAYACIPLIVIAWNVWRVHEGWRMWFLYCVQRTYSGLCFHWRANQRCPIPSDGPALIIANHRSPVDPMMVWTNHHCGSEKRKIRSMRFLTAREYFGILGVGWICRAMRSIPVARDGSDMKPVRKALKQLKQGHIVGVFPEGHINMNPQVLDHGNPGVAWLAVKAQAPVYPVFIHDAPQGKNMVEPFIKASRVRVSYGEPIDLSPYAKAKLSQDVLAEVTTLLMTRLAELGGIEAADAKAECIPIDTHATG